MSLSVSGRFAIMALLVCLVQIDLLRDGGLEFLSTSAGTDFRYCGSALACEAGSCSFSKSWRVSKAVCMLTWFSALALWMCSQGCGVVHGWPLSRHARQKIRFLPCGVDCHAMIAPVLLPQVSLVFSMLTCGFGSNHFLTLAAV